MKMAQRLLIMLLSFGILVSVAHAKKKNNNKKNDEPKVGPFVEVEVSSRIMKCIDDYDKLKAAMLKLYEKRDKNWGHNDLKKYKEKIYKLKTKIDDLVERETKSITSKADKIMKEIDNLEKKSDKEKSVPKQDAIKAEIDKLMETQKDLDTVSAQYKVFSRYCNPMRKNPNEKDLDGTALDYRGKNMPKIGDAVEGYFAIVFCSSQNKSSISALKSVRSLGLDKVIGVVCDKDEALFKKNFVERVKGKNMSYIQDADYSLAQKHNVMFLPTIFIGDKDGQCFYAMSGTSTKQLHLIKSLIKAKEKEAEKAKKEAEKAKR